MTSVTIDLPESAFISQGETRSPDEFVRDMRLAAATFWYQKGEISQEKAAEMAGLNRRDLFAKLAREKIDVFVVDFEDLDRELKRG